MPSEVIVVGAAAAQAIDANSDQPVPGAARGARQMGRLVAQIIGDEVTSEQPVQRPVFYRSNWAEISHSY